MDKVAFDKLGYAKIPFDPALETWAANALPHAISAVNNPQNHPLWLRAQGTWFVGVDALQNAPNGSLKGSSPLTGEVLAAAQNAMGQDIFDWGLAQASVCYKGYPKQSADESDAGYRYRLKRDSAHLDGLKPVGETRKRKLQEFHGFILGIPLNEYPDQAAPFVIWEGSHIILRDMLINTFENIAPENWDELDITDIYQETRARIFDTCRRVELHAKPGEAYIAHRFALHGMAQWPNKLDGPKEGRVIAYFRPFWQMDRTLWLGNNSYA